MLSLLECFLGEAMIQSRFEKVKKHEKGQISVVNHGVKFLM